MKFSHLKIQNVLAISNIDVAINTPIVLFAGRNEAGKTSIQEAVRMALTEDAVRVAYKKEYDQLVRDGEKTGMVQVLVDDVVVGSIKLPTGDYIESQSAELPRKVVRALVDAHRFASLDQTQRRAFLFSLMGLRVDKESVIERLVARKCDEKVCREIAGQLGGGFDAAAKYAAGQATEAKGAWKAVTTETYGAKKADTWEAHAPALTRDEADELVAVDALLEQLKEEEGMLQNRSGELTVKMAAFTTFNRRLLAARDNTHIQPGDLPAAENAVAEHVKVVDDLRARSQGVQTGVEHECPACKAQLLLQDSGALVVKPKKGPKEDKQAKKDLPAAEQKLERLRRDVTTIKNAMEALTKAQGALAELEKTKPEKPDEQAQQTLADAHARVKGDIEKQDSRRLALWEKRGAADKAMQKTKLARAHHDAVTRWTAVAEALSADGIPAEILSESLKPLNERLAHSSDLTKWKLVTLDGQMDICVGSHAYHLMSESAKWRADALLAEAISHLSGAKLMFLDRLDVNDIPARVALLSWLDTLVAAGQLDSAIITGTFKSKPHGLPASITVHWLEAGAIVEEATA